MTAGPAVSVLMAVYDGERYLRQAVESILRQTFSDFEFLAVDDGSTDGTADILRSYRDPRFRLFRNPRNLGLAACLNRGIDEARGRYIARMDADDISLPERLARQVVFLDEHPEIGACGAWYRVFGERDQEIRLPTDADEIKCRLFFYNVLAHPAVVLRTEAFREAGLRYDVSYGTSQDYDLWVRASRRFPLANVGEFLLLFRVHPGQQVRRHRGKQVETACIVRRRQVEELGILPGDEELRIHDSLCVPSGSEAFCSEALADAWIDKLKAANGAKGLFPEAVFSRVLDEQRDALRRAAAVSRESVRAPAWRRAAPAVPASGPPAGNGDADGRPAGGAGMECRRTGWTTVRISVAVCTRNRSALLARVLESLCAQTLDRSMYEVIVVDNGSTDASPAVAGDFARRYPNVRYLREERVGLSHARNRGWMEAAGEYVAYTDDDCKAPPEWLARAERIAAEISPPVFGGPYRPYYDSPRPAWYLDRYASFVIDGPARLLGPGEFLSGGNVFFRRSVLRGAGGFRSDFGMSGETLAFGEETELLLRLRAASPGTVVYYDPGLLVYHLVRPEKMTLGWIVRQKFRGGIYARRTFSAGSPPADGPARLMARALGTVGRIAADLVRGALRRDRSRYPYYRNFLFEEIFPHVIALGGIFERIRELPGPAREARRCG